MAGSRERIPPHDVEAEAALLGAMILDRDVAADYVDRVRADDFHLKAHRLVFEAISGLVEQNAPIDGLLLKQELVRRGTFEEAGGQPFLVELMEALPSAAAAKHCARQVRDLARLRRLVRACEETLEEVYRRADETDKILDRAEQKVFEIRREAPVEAGTVGVLLEETIKRVEQRQTRKGLGGLHTGFADLNDRLDGLQRGNLIIVAARPSMGKTSFALNIASRAAFKTKKTVLVFSLEVPREQVVENLLAQTARVNAHRMRKGELDQERDWPRILEAANLLQESAILIDDTPGLSTVALRAKARRVARGCKEEDELGLIVVDYLQLMTHSRAESRQHEITMISQALKTTARELNVPVLALSQLNRAVDARQDHRPVMSDLRESGSIEQDADVILFLYRPAYYKEVPENERRDAEVIIAKHRNGPTGTVKLLFFDEYLRFEDRVRGVS